jgi:surface protein
MSITRTSSKKSNNLGYSSSWVRPSDWTEMPTITTNRFAGLYPIYDSLSEYVCIGAATSTGTYTVDWGDGSTTTHTSLSNAEHTYNYADIASAVTSRGYKTALIQVYPTTGGANLTNIYTNVKHSLNKGTTVNWLDMRVAVWTSGDIQVSSTTCTNPLLERFELIVGAVSTTTPPFYNAYHLQYLSPLNIGSGTTTAANMFNGCKRLEYIPEIRTGGIGNSSLRTMTNMFNACSNLRYVSTIELSISQSHLCDNMFSNCGKLEVIPAFKFVPNTTAAMFASCYSLKQIDATFNMVLCTTTSSMFNGCASLNKLPDLSTFTSSYVNSSLMFSGCTALSEIPLFDTSNVTNANQMFSGCTGLTSIPNFNLSKATVDSLYFNCTGLTTVPTLTSTNALTSTTSTYNGCTALSSITGSFPASSVTFTTSFPTGGNLRSLTFTPLATGFAINGNMFSADALLNVFNQLSYVNANPSITITNNPGVITPISKASSGFTAKSSTITISNTASLAVGMQVTGTGSPLQTNTSFTTTAATSTFGLTAHGIPNDTPISVIALTTTTGITLRRIHYVVNATADTFQISTTLGGSPITFTNNGSCTMRWKSVIVSINTNVSVVMSAPMASTGTVTATFQQLPTWIPLLQAWTVTQ